MGNTAEANGGVPSCRASTRDDTVASANFSGQRLCPALSEKRRTLSIGETVLPTAIVGDTPEGESGPLNLDRQGASRESVPGFSGPERFRAAREIVDLLGTTISRGRVVRGWRGQHLRSGQRSAKLPFHGVRFSTLQASARHARYLH